MATVHLLHGLPGSGKSTFARKLEREARAVRFSPDEWMIALHGRNPPAEHFADYHNRISSLIWTHAERVLAVDRDVIMDFGFWTRRSRDEARERVLRMGAAYRFYRVRCAPEVAKARVLARNAREDSLVIDEPAFVFFQSLFEPMDTDEERVDVAGSE